MLESSQKFYSETRLSIPCQWKNRAFSALAPMLWDILLCEVSWLLLDNILEGRFSPSFEEVLLRWFHYYYIGSFRLPFSPVQVWDSLLSFGKVCLST